MHPFRSAVESGNQDAVEDLLADDVLFTSPVAFPAGPGRTTDPKDFASLMDDLEQRVFDALSDDTVVYPGHGRDTNLGIERPNVPEWRKRGW